MRKDTRSCLSVLREQQRPAKGQRMCSRGRLAILTLHSLPQVPSPTRAMTVVMRDTLIQDRPQVPRPRDQHPVGDLSPGCADPSLGISARPLRGGIFTTSIPRPRAPCQTPV
jgi:hypothetical protein